jgi:hypothetical protein
VQAKSILPASMPAFDESIVLSGVHCRINFYDEAGHELVGRRELRRFGHLASAIEQTLSLAPDSTPIQTTAGEALEQINSRRRR